MMGALLQDLRHGARLLLKAPGFTAVAVAALAIGIGANTAIFSVVNTLLIQRLPYPDGERLAVIWEHNIPRDRKNNVISPGNFIHWRELQQSFDDIAAIGMTFNTTLTGHGDPVEIPFQYVTAAFFPVVGVSPATGRAFTEAEDRPDAHFVVISDRMWKRRLNADPTILQKSITLGGESYSILGVMPPGFSFLDKTVDLWLPVGFSAESRTPRGRWMMAVGRLKNGLTFEQAQRDMVRVHAELTRRFPDFNTGWTARVVPLREQLTGDIRAALYIMLGAVGFVLLIACANVANLLLARATARQRELAVRAALGAGRARLVRQLLAESLVLATAGGIAGLLLAWWALHLLRVVVAERLPIQRLEFVRVDGWVLGFTLLASLVCGIVFGLVPAVSAAGGGLTSALKEGGRAGSAARGKRARSAFVVVEVALALMLLVGAGLLVRSFMRVLQVDAGFDPDRTITMRVALSGPNYTEPQKRTRFFQTAFDRIDALPGVQAAGAVSFLPITGLGSATGYQVVGQPIPPAGQGPVCDVRVIVNDYFKAMGIPLLRGRLFNEQDAADNTNRVIVNEAMVRRHWPNEDPIGKKVKISWNDDREDEIVGVVGDVRHQGLETSPRSTIYWPHGRFAYGSMTFAIRTATDPASIVNEVGRIVRNQDPNLAVADVQTLDQVLEKSVAQRRLTMLLLTIFACAALVLAAVGIYGVIAYSVTQRTQEIGIRMALGAQRTDVLGMVMRQSAALALTGIAIGAAGAFALTRLMTDLLFEVKPFDPVTFLTVAAVLGAIAMLASFIPGHRATRVDPVVALRAE
jgi:putative ABC transport system permease protein